MSTDAWRRCSSCKTDIPHQAIYWVCNVSTCNRKRTGLFFCSVSCWEAHLPTMRHREAWAVEKTAPTREAAAREQAEESAKTTRGVVAERRIVGTSSTDSSSVPSPPYVSDEELPMDVLIVASKLKNYIRAKGGMRTSDTCIEALSQIVRDACNEAIRRAGSEGRQTVMDRDFRHY